MNVDRYETHAQYHTTMLLEEANQIRRMAACRAQPGQIRLILALAAGLERAGQALRRRYEPPVTLPNQPSVGR